MLSALQYSSNVLIEQAVDNVGSPQLREKKIIPIIRLSGKLQQEYAKLEIEIILSISIYIWTSRHFFVYPWVNYLGHI